MNKGENNGFTPHKWRVEITNPRLNKTFRPALKEPIKVTWKREGEPGKLEFTPVKNGDLSYQNGNMAILFCDDDPVFAGWIFTKTRSDLKTIDCVAYDQIRYLKYKDTIQYDNKSYGEIVKMVASDHNLRVGSIAETGVKMSRTEEDVELYDIFDKAYQNTLIDGGEAYVLYDNVGKLELKNIRDMVYKGKVFDEKAMQSWDYSNTIDDGTYNRVKITVKDDTGGQTETLVAENPEHIKDWGVLQFHAVSNEPKELIKMKADDVLKKVDRPVRKLTLKGVLGDIAIRGGTVIYVNLPLGDMQACAAFWVESVTHTIRGNSHLMDLEIQNEDFLPAIDVSNVFKNEQSDSEEGGDGDGTFHALPGNTNAERIWNAFRKMGYSAAATAGIMGNMWRESGFDPTINEVGGTGNGRGLAQWDVRNRWQTLITWSATKGLDYKSIEAQCQFVDYELNSGGLSYWLNRHGSLAQFKQTDNPAWAVAWFYDVFERGLRRDSDIAKSTPVAQKYYNQWRSYGMTVGSGSAPAKLMAAVNSTPWPGADLCATWVSRVFNQVTGRYATGNGNDMTRNWCHSSNLKDLRPGMVIGCVVSPWSAAYGHIAIYVGGDTIYSSERSGIIKRSVREFINMYGPNNGGSQVLWGWMFNQPLS
ncbi:MAG: phage tail tip lysozyme [Clostridia bacterium]|nr:phage tail tip lysozyme [Clostridia bacterium]